MKRGFPSFLLTAAMFAFSPFGDAAQTNTVIIPKEASTVFGSSAADPFFQYDRVEQIYAASEFAVLPQDIIRITGIAFRVNESSRQLLDAVLGRLELRMNIFRGSLQEAVERKTGVESPQEVVFDSKDVHLTGRVGQVEAFDVRLSFQKPYVYDRRLGQLVLEIDPEERSGNLAGMDGVGFFGQFDRGALIVIEPLGYRRVDPITLVTEVSYQTLFATIDSIRKVDDSVQVDFTPAGNPKLVQIESAPVVTGPYALEEGAELAGIGDTGVRAVLPASSANRFFRVRLE